MNDATLQAAKINAGGDININVVNNLGIATATEVHKTSYSLKDKGNYFFKNGESGNYNTEVVNTEITSNTNADVNSNLAFNVGNAAIVQYSKNDVDNSNIVTRTGLDGSVLYGDFSNNEKLSYVEKLDASKTFYNSVEEVSKSWDQTTRGLTSTGQAVVAITATAGTAGAMGPVNGSVGKAALVAGTATAASTASVAVINSAINADGDIFKQLKTIFKDTLDTTTSKESVKNMVISASAASLTTGLTNIADGGSFTTPANNTVTTTPTTTNTLERVSTNLQNSFQEVATQTVVSTAVQSGINGDSFVDSLEDQAKNVVIYTVAKVAANEIGRAAHGSATTLTDSNGNLLTNIDGTVMTTAQIDKVTQLAFHAGLGAVTAKLTGNDASSGAIAGVVGELTAEGATEAGLDESVAINLSKLTGAVTSSTYGNLTNQSDEQIANNVWEGSRIASNAAENNALYINKDSLRVVAADGKNDHKVILIDESEGNSLFNKNMENILANSMMMPVDDTIIGVMKVDSSYQNQTDGQFYDLTDKRDFNYLTNLTGKDGLSYSPETSDVIFNQKNEGDMAKIFFQNGMQNDYRDALASANLIKNLTGQEVGLIVNATGGSSSNKAGYLKDIAEYLPPDLYLKDVLNGEVYQQIANNSGGKAIVVMHSAGNNDGYQAAQVLKLNGVDLEGKIDFVSVDKNL